MRHCGSGPKNKAGKTFDAVDDESVFVTLNLCKADSPE